MVNIILLGPAGTGKHRLLDHLRTQNRSLKRHTIIRGIAKNVLDNRGISTGRDFNCDDSMYGEIQEEILDRQCKAELNCQTEYITDNCIISCLVHVYMCLADSALIDKLSSTPSAEEVIKGYQSSLVVLMCFKSSYTKHSVGLQCLETEDNVSSIKNAYKVLLKRFSIPFIDVFGADIEEQSRCIANAIDGNVSLYSGSLENYKAQKRADEGKNRRNDSVEVQTSFAFYKIRTDLNSGIKIPTIKLYEHYYEQIWTSYSPGKTNRYINEYGYNDLACIEFSSTIRSSRVQRTLLNGVRINGELYSFLGCSSGGLKKRKCFLLKGNEADVNVKINSLGKFESIMTVSKRLTRISLLFTEVQLTSIKVTADAVCEIGDIANNNYNFSDGCGLIGRNIVSQLHTEIKHSLYDEYVPTVYQVRFQGYKGVLALDSNNENINKISVRPSMKKFETDKLPYLGICEYSKAYSYGNLNKQYIMLLSGLGVSDEVFVRRQRECLDLIGLMTNDSKAAILMLQWQENFQFAQYIVKAGGIDKMSGDIRAMVHKGLKILQNQLKGKVEKLNILIPKSRNLFGICDPSSELKYGECFVRLTLSGQPYSLSGKVVVCKNPCYLTGDVRVLNAVSDVQNPRLTKLNHLIDCIVFPSRGKRPHSSEIAGSDLDGDKYFVTWDEELVPVSTRPPYDYPSIEAKPEGHITREKLIEYFSRQNECGKLMGRINSYYNIWADSKGVNCIECERLGQLFSRAVDAIKTGDSFNIPEGLIPQYAPGESHSCEANKVWTVMGAEATQFKETFATEMIKQSDPDISEDLVSEIVNLNNIHVPEYEKFKFIWNHIKQKTGLDDESCVQLIIQKYNQNIEFSKFTVEEKKEALRVGFPRNELLNSVMKSRVLDQEDIQYLMMNGFQWKWNSILSKQNEECDWRYILKSLTTYDNTLIVFGMPDGVVILVIFLEKQMMGKEIQINPGTIYVVLISKHFGYINKYIVGPNFFLDLTEDTFQLYRDKKVNLTLLWLKSSDRKKTRGRWNKSLSDEIMNSVSMDIQRYPSINSKGNHPLINKIPFREIEVYAQTISDETAYWDMHDANFIGEVEEEVELETEDDEDYDICVDGITEKIGYDDLAIRNVREEDIHLVYEKVSETSDAVLFQSLCERRPICIKDTIRVFIFLLNNIFAKVVPSRLSGNTSNSIRLITTMLTESLENQGIDRLSHVDILSVSRCLCVLGMQKEAQKIISAVKTKLKSSIDSFLDAVIALPRFWMLEIDLRIEIIKLFYHSLGNEVTDRGKFEYGEQAGAIRSEEVEHHEFMNLERYLQKYGFLHGLYLVYEVNAWSKKKMDLQSLRNLKLDKTSTKDSSLVTFYKSSAVKLSDEFLLGQFVVISLQRLANRRPFVETVCAFGSIHTLIKAPFSVTIKLDHKLPDVIASSQTKEGVRYWQIDIIGNIVPYTRVASAMKIIWENRNSLDITRFLSPDTGTKDTEEICKANGMSTRDHGTSCDMLNQQQSIAFEMAMKQEICLIQGPPGTGKTSVACSIIKRIVAENKYKGKLVVAETNTAVDNLARRLQNHLLIVRLGTTNDSDLFDITVEGHLKSMTANKATRTSYKDEYGDSHRKPKLVSRIISSADVVLATCVGAGEALLKDHRFEFVLMDEATKTMETSLLCCLSHGVKHLVMIGDHKQLGPLVPEDKEIPKLDDLPDIQELSRSLFHRLCDKIPYAVLETQYRMHPGIMEFPSVEFYDGRLKAADSTRSRDQVKFDWPMKGTPICFINVEGREKRIANSYANEKEVDVVVKVVNRLLHSDYDPNKKDDRPISVNDIGVLTLYQGQEKILRSCLSRNIMVKSVDGFQGQEKDVIVVSTVRCNDRGSVGFSGDANRINVLLTRSKRGLIVIGNRTTIETAPIWERWLNKVPFLVWREVTQNKSSEGKSKSKRRI